MDEVQFYRIKLKEYEMNMNKLDEERAEFGLKQQDARRKEVQKISDAWHAIPLERRVELQFPFPCEEQ